MSLDLIVCILFFAAQWRLLVLMSRRLAKAGVSLRTLLLGFGVFELLVAAGYACTFSQLTSRIHFAGLAVIGAIAFCYLFTSGCAAALYSLWQPIQRRLDRDTNLARRRALNMAGNALLAAPFAALGYGAFIERTNFQVNEVDLRLAGLPHDLDGLRILQLSDIHLSAFLSERELGRVIDAACELKSHLALATGDFISTFGDPLEACIRQLKRVKSDAGMFGCLGNHERYAHAERAATELAAGAGIPILRSESRQLRFGNSILNLVGVDYQSISQREKYLRGSERLVYPGALNVLLSHNPDVFPVAARKGYDVVIGGHTHGGQVTVEILDESINPARFFTPYVRGLYREGNAAVYVTRGIGTIGIPARLCAPPEITLLRLRKA